MTPGQAQQLLWNALKPVEREDVDRMDAVGRILAGSYFLDRDSPACDVSAMDGYVLRMADWGTKPMEVAGQIMMGQAPGIIPAGKAVRIFTGGAVPTAGQVVIPREHVIESEDGITPRPGAPAVYMGQHIRQRGENGRAGEVLCQGGRVVTYTMTGGLAATGYARVSVYRQVRVAVLVTGNELVGAEAVPELWQIRDSNGPAVVAFLKKYDWVSLVRCIKVRDDPAAITEVLRSVLEEADVVVTTGGISMGDHDYVPQAIEMAGGKILFRKLPIRPGKPILAAQTAGGKIVISLPGNPVAVWVGLRMFVLAALERLAGCACLSGPDAQVQEVSLGVKRVPLWCYRLVREVEPGKVVLVENQGSGDVIAGARSDGMIEVLPEGDEEQGLFSYYRF